MKLKIIVITLLCFSFSYIKYDGTNHVSAGSQNLFNVATSTPEKYVNWDTGFLEDNSNYAASDFIPVEPSKEYLVTGFNRGLAFYGSSKQFISGIEFPGSTLTIPNNAYFIRVTPFKDETDTFKFSKVDPLVIDNTIRLVLPPTIYALEGQELNIYFDNIMNDKDTEYDFDVICPIGGQYENYFRVTPSTVGTYPITIKAFKDGSAVATVTSEIIVSDADVGSGINKKILIIGDSTTANGLALSKLNEDFNNDVMDITLIGTKGSNPNKNEAAVGWSTNMFYSDTRSPFVFNGAFNFSSYMSTNSLNNPDYVFINLGINDVFSYQDDASLIERVSTMLTQYQGMINSIKSYNPGIKIGIAVTIPPAYDQDAFGKMYGNDFTRWRVKRNNFIWTTALIDRFKDRETDGVYLIPINASIDTRNNYGLEELPVNARNPMVKKQSTIANGHVHPDISGYWQTMDVYWYFLKSFEN